MNIDNFIQLYSTEYMSLFHEETIETIEVKESTLSKISNFLFEPRYKVDNLKFTAVS